MKDNNKGLITRFYGFGTMKRAIAFLLAAVMLLMIVSCGKNSDAPAGNGPSSDGGSQNEYSEYSVLLQNVMSDAEYNDLIARAQKDNKFYSSAEFDAHPYAFLEKEGFDIAKIKNGSIPCHTMTYVLDEEPNNLYIYTRVEKTDAYYLYLLRYTLTEKEMDDYNMLNYTGGTRVMSRHSSSTTKLPKRETQKL